MKKKIIVILSLLAAFALTGCFNEIKENVNTSTPATITTGTTGTTSSAVELITNGDFTASTGWNTDKSGTASWGAGGTGGDLTVAYDTGAAVATIVRGGSTINYEAQLFTTVSLVSGKTYTVSFEYSADISSSIGFSIENSSTYDVYLGESTSDKKAALTANTTKQTYTKTFTATETNAAAKVVFLLSSAPTGAKITIDNVSLKEGTTAGATTIGTTTGTTTTTTTTTTDSGITTGGAVTTGTPLGATTISTMNWGSGSTIVSESTIKDTYTNVIEVATGTGWGGTTNNNAAVLGLKGITSGILTGKTELTVRFKANNTGADPTENIEVQMLAGGTTVTAYSTGVNCKSWTTTNGWHEVKFNMSSFGNITGVTDIVFIVKDDTAQNVYFTDIAVQ